MLFHELIRTAVGADLSRPPPIYRPRWLSRYLDYFVQCHHRPSLDFHSPDEHVKKHHHVRRRHNSFRIGPTIESDCFKLAKILIRMSRHPQEVRISNENARE